MRPAIINNVSSIGSNDPGNPWSAGGSYSQTINRDKLNVIYFHLNLNTAFLRDKSTLHLCTKIYNSEGMQVFDNEVDFAWQSNFDKCGTGWILKGGDGTYIPSGKYRATFRVEDSKLFAYEFFVTSDMDISMGMRSRRLQMLNAEYNRVSAEITNLSGLFADMKRKKLEKRLGEIEAEINRLNRM